MQQPQQEVHDVVVASIAESIATVKTLFGLETSTQLIPFSKIVIACRSLGGGAHEEVVAPIVNGILEELKLNPIENEADLETAAEFAEVIAMAISDATQLIYQQMQMAQAEAARRSAAGNGQALIGT